MVLMALGLVFAFAATATAEKSVVAIMKATKADAKILDGNFKTIDYVALDQTKEYAEAGGDVTHAVWDLESEEVWYKYIKGAMDLAGGMPIKQGETVLIKPNFVLTFYSMFNIGYGDANSIQGALADPRACLAAARVASEMGAGRIIISECPALGDSWTAFSNFGLMHAQERYAKMGIKYELIDLCVDSEMMPGLGLSSMKEYPMPKILREVDCLVNICAFKTHAYAGVTLALKNFGVGLPSSHKVGGYKIGLPHQELAEVTVDVNHIAQKLVPKQMHIIDAVYAGTWVPVAPYFLTGYIMASKDPVALDAIGTAVMNHNPRNIGTIRMAAEHGLGKMGFDEIEVVGVPLEEAIIQDFPRHPYKGRWHPWAPDKYGKVTNWDQYYRHELFGVPTYPKW
jgi:uncharacterized protein (DUF362 family)